MRKPHVLPEGARSRWKTSDPSSCLLICSVHHSIRIERKPYPIHYSLRLLVLSHCRSKRTWRHWQKIMVLVASRCSWYIRSCSEIESWLRPSRCAKKSAPSPWCTRRTVTLLPRWSILHICQRSVSHSHDLWHKSVSGFSIISILKI